MTRALPKNESETSVRTPRADFFRGDAGYAIHVDLPGVTTEELELDVRDQRLLITGAPTPLNLRYRRSFRVPRDADMASVEANLAHGVLRVRVPRVASAASTKIPVSDG